MSEREKSQLVALLNENFPNPMQPNSEVIPAVG